MTSLPSEPKPELQDTQVPQEPTSSSASVDEVAEEKAAAEAKEDDTQYPGGFKLAAIVAALVLSIFLVSLDMTIVATAIPRITDQFHSLDDVGWYGSAFFLTLASFQSTWGKAYKYFPLKWSFLLSIFIFELGSLICGVSKDSTTLIVGRAIAGAGGAGIASGAYTIIAFAAPPQQRPAFTGILGATYGGASVIGPLLGGVFTDHATWRWCFYVNLPIGGASAFIIFLFFTAPKAADPLKATWKEKILQMDLIGTFTIMAGVVCYLLALQWCGLEKSWNNSTVIGTLIGFVLIIILFVLVEWYMAEKALLVPRILKKRGVAVGGVFIFFLAGGFFLYMYYLPIYFQSIFNVSASNSGIRNLALILSCSISTIVSGILITIFGHPTPLLVLGGVIATIGAGTTYMLDIGSSSSHWIGFQIILGIGVGLAIQVPIMAGQAAVEPKDISTVTAIILFFQTLGGAFFVSAGESAFGNKMLGSLPITAPGVNPALVLATGATELRKTFPADAIEGIMVSYMKGLHTAFALGIAACGVAAVVSVFAEWKSIKGKEVSAAAA